MPMISLTAWHPNRSSEVWYVNSDEIASIRESIFGKSDVALKGGAARTVYGEPAQLFKLIEESKNKPLNPDLLHEIAELKTAKNELRASLCEITNQVLSDDGIVDGFTVDHAVKLLEKYEVEV